MTKCRNGNAIARHFYAANHTAHHVIIATLFGTGRQNVVFSYSLGCSVKCVLCNLVARAGDLVEADRVAFNVGRNVNSEHFRSNAREIEGKVLSAPCVRGRHSVRAVFLFCTVKNCAPLSVNVSFDSEVRTKVAGGGGIRLCVSVKVVDAELIELISTVKIYGSVNVLSLGKSCGRESTALG